MIKGKQKKTKFVAFAVILLYLSFLTACEKTGIQTGNYNNEQNFNREPQAVEEEQCQEPDKNHYRKADRKQSPETEMPQNQEAEEEKVQAADIIKNQEAEEIQNQEIDKEQNLELDNLQNQEIDKERILESDKIQIQNPDKKQNQEAKKVIGKESTATGSEGQKQEKTVEKITIGVTLASEDSSYIRNLVTYMKEAALEKDVQLLIAYANWDADTQAEQMEKYINQQVDAIILCPVNSKSMLTSLKKVQEAKIPVINLNMKVDSISTQYIDTYVGASMSEEASFAADLVTDALGIEGGEVAIIEGSPGSDAQIYRTQAFMKGIASSPQIKVVALGNGEWDRAKAYMVTKDILDKNPNIKAIFSQDNNMAMGVIKALEELKKEDSIIVVGIGEDSKEYLQAIKSGKLYGMITQPPSYEGNYSVYTAVMAASGKELRPWYKDPIDILTMKDLND